MRRSQAALEFLTTYGWGLLALLIVIGAFMYFQVFKPDFVLPDRCILSPEFVCMDHEIIASPQTVNFEVKNAVGTAVTINVVNVTYIGENYPWVTCTPNSAMLAPKEQSVISCDFTGLITLSAKEPARFEIWFNYTTPDTIFPVTVRGELYGRPK